MQCHCRHRSHYGRHRRLHSTQQNDIKRVLAYSTLSQLGYMVMALGLLAGEAAMFHLFTHAWFKVALLFLGAGAIIFMPP